MVSYTKLVSLFVSIAASATALEERQLHTLPPQGSSSSIKSTSLSISPSSSAASVSTTGLPTTLATQSGPTRWQLTTTFTQPTDCVGGITQYAGALSSLGYWLNIPHPAPQVTITSCFPPALVASVTAAVDLPPYEQLVCPYQWESFDYNSTYRICCPKNFGLYAPGLRTHTDRPGLGAWCTSWAPAGTHAVLTQYNTNGGSSLIDTTLGPAENWLVQATAFDGIIATNVPTSTLTSSKSSTSSSSSASSSIPSTTTISTSTRTTPKSTLVSTTTTTAHASATPTWTGPTAINELPQCGGTCIGNMLNKYKELGCGPFDAACMCRAPDFNYGVRDCANAACTDTAQAKLVVSFETSYWCPSYMATGTHSPTQSPTPTAISNLPPCGQTCMNNMIKQYSTLGCKSPDAACLCKNPNFGYGVRDCANGACGTAVAPTITNFASSHYCSPTPKP